MSPFMTGESRAKQTRNVVLAAAMLATVVVTLDVSVVNIAMPQFERTFGVGADAAQMGAQRLHAGVRVAAAQLGRAGRSLGSTPHLHRQVRDLRVAASLACGVAPSWPVLLTARGCQGIGAALLVSSALAMIQQSIPEPAARARAIGWWAASGSAALAAGPVVGGALVTAWRAGEASF